ncbi:UNVERIFIED_CONTAM: hypothetical protein HDU68_005664 [Siphonaria sp. JEL0065]|nr:hypothetical protein HDU68_005664 [Siphonaria sp. JEL0065]
MDLVPKLNHSIPAVRERAWASLQFKMEHGLLPEDAALTTISNANADPSLAAAAKTVAKLLLPKLSHPHSRVSRSPTRVHLYQNTRPRSTDAAAQPQTHTHTRNRTRTLSPKKLPSLYPPTLLRFPVIQSAFPSYNYIHLSPIDEEAVADFLLFVQQPAVDNEIEPKLFHILVTDFGSEIFLQKPQLFRLILSGLEAESPDRACQSQIYISKLVIEWSKVFRRFVDGPFSLSSQTPISATPNVSITAAGVGGGGGNGPFLYGDINNPASLGDSSLSIPFACHEVFFVLCRLISEGSAPIQCLDTLNSTVPMVMLHLETIKYKAVNLDPIVTIDEFCFDYVAAILPCICYIASSGTVMDEKEAIEKLAWKEKLVELICVLVKAFQTVSLAYFIATKGNYQKTDVQLGELLICHFIAVSVREFSFNELVKRFPQFSTETAFSDAVVFNQSILSMNPDNEKHLYEGRAGLLDLPSLVTELKNRENPNMDLLMTGLERLAIGIYDSSILQRAKDLQVLATLFGCLIERREWFQRGQALLHVLKISRILTSLSLKTVFDELKEDVLIQIIRSEYLFNANEFIRYEFSKLIFLLLFNHCHFIDNGRQRSALGIIENGSIFLFDCVPQKYFVYTANEAVSLKALEGVDAPEEISDSVGLMFQGYHFAKFQTDAHPVKVWMDGLFQQLRESKSHEQFQAALDCLFACIVFDDDYHELAKYPLEGLLNRFVLVHPANYNDEQLLICIIRHLAKAMRKSQTFFASLKEMFFQSLTNLILPILQSTSQLKTTDQNLSALSSEFILLLRTVLKSAAQEDVGRILKTTNCLDVLINYTYYIFSLECKDVMSHSDRISCLECLVVIARYPAFVYIVPGQIGSAFIQLLVSVMGFSQQNYVNSTDGNAFTYQDRSIYRLVARSLRNVSRCFVVLQSSFSNWLWGDHWFFEGDIEWLLVLLNDDERIIQKYGLGILGNLILIKNSYPLLCLKIPQFLDMAFLYALDFERNYTLRKEALLIINNFLITFCHDNKINQVALLPTSDESLAEIDTVADAANNVKEFRVRESMSSENNAINQNEAYSKVTDLLDLFEHCGFFDQLRALITDCDKFTSIYMDALTGLLLNLSILSPSFMYQKLCNTDSWEVLLNFLEATYSDDSESDENSHSSTSSSSSSSPSGLKKFRKTQFKQCYSHFTESVQCNILNIVRLSLAENSMDIAQNLLFGNVGLLDHLKGFVNDAVTRVRAKEDISVNCITVVFHIISDVLHLAVDFAGTFNLCEWLESDETGLKIMEICCVAFAKSGAFRAGGGGHGGGGMGDETEGVIDVEDVASNFKKVACLLLSRMLALHYSEMLNLNIEHNLSAASERTPDHCMGEYLTMLLVEMVSETLGEMDLIFIEAVRVCLQALLSKFDAAKSFALSNGVIELFTNRIDAILRGCKQGKITEKHRVALHFSFCVLRHIFAGSVAAKEIGYTRNVYRLINQTLNLMDLNEPLLLESLLCLQNAVTNCHHPASLLDCLVKTNCSVVGAVGRIMKEQVQSDDVFLSSVNVMKVLVLKTEIRTALIKSSFFGDCLVVVKRLSKDKEATKVANVLLLLRNFTFTLDGQAHAIKTKGLFAFLIDLLAWKSTNIHIACLVVLRNLAIAKENKPFFLADENFLPQLLGLLDGCKTVPVADALTSFIWVLAYDSEKTKAALKAGRLLSILDKLDFGLKNMAGEKTGVSHNINQIRSLFS